MTCNIGVIDNLERYYASLLLFKFPFFFLAFGDINRGVGWRCWSTSLELGLENFMSLASATYRGEISGKVRDVAGKAPDGY